MMKKDYTNMPRKPMMAGGTAGMTEAASGMGMKKKMAMGGKPMAKDPKTGGMKPTYAMDGKGKMMYGGMSKKNK